jgi:hypothetical protein
MKIDISFLTGFFLVGTDLLARAAVQGVEQALITTTIEYGSAAMVWLSTWTKDWREITSHRPSQVQRDRGKMIGENGCEENTTGKDLNQN